MRAVVYKAPHRLSIEERERPVPGPGEALVQVTATGICGSDVHGYTGETGRRALGMIMGHEFSGRLVDFGPDTDPPEGWYETAEYALNPVIACWECVYCLAGHNQQCVKRRLMGVTPDIIGSYADYVVLPVRNANPLGDGVSADWGALVEPLSVGFHAVGRSGVGPGMQLVIIGAGPIGIAVLLAARRVGAGPVIVSEPHEGRRAIAAGYDAVTIDPVNESLSERVREVTGPLGSGHVIDAVGSRRTLPDSLSVVAPEGTLVLLGMHEPLLEFNSYALSVPERQIAGSFCYSEEEFSSTARWVAQAPRDLEGYVGGEVGYDGIGERFATLAAGGDAALKVLFKPAI